MAYTPTTWQSGDTITAEKLNNMESGIRDAAALGISSGSWTPTLSGMSSYSYQRGRYVKIGDVAIVSFSVWGIMAGSNTEQIKISGSPPIAGTPAAALYPAITRITAQPLITGRFPQMAAFMLTVKYLVAATSGSPVTSSRRQRASAAAAELSCLRRIVKGVSSHEIRALKR